MTPKMAKDIEQKGEIVDWEILLSRWTASRRTEGDAKGKGDK